MGQKENKKPDFQRNKVKVLLDKIIQYKNHKDQYKKAEQAGVKSTKAEEKVKEDLAEYIQEIKEEIADRIETERGKVEAESIVEGLKRTPKEIKRKKTSRKRAKILKEIYEENIDEQAERKRIKEAKKRAEKSKKEKERKSEKSRRRK